MPGSLSNNSSSLNLTPQTKDKKLAIVSADWNSNITQALTEGCLKVFKAHEFPDERILQKTVPGSFEIPLGAQYMAEFGFVHGVVCIGCIIQGETPHFHYIADMVTQKIGDLNLSYNIPFIYGILTVDNEEQARARAGGAHGNKGKEAAYAALEMLELRQSLQQGKQQAGFR